MVGLEERTGPGRPIPHTENSILQASRPRCSGGHVHAPDNCLKRIGGDILEMSCAGIISIPLVLACMQSVRAMERANRGRRKRGIYYTLHIRGFIGRAQWGWTRAVQRALIISVSHLKTEGGQQQWPRQEDDGDLEKQRVNGSRC